MKFKAKSMGISTGGPLVVAMHQDDADHFDLHTLDRIKVFRGRRVETVLVDIVMRGGWISSGVLGLFEEVRESLHTHNGDIVQIMHAKKPLSVDIIKKKLDGCKLTQQEIEQIVWDIVHHKLTDIEMTYFVAACYSRHMDMQETIWLTRAMTHQGDILHLPVKPVLDKHCVGGVAGNRTTMIIVPIVASAGLSIPKTSSRSITSPAGTADTMEVLARVSISLEKMKSIVLKTQGCVVWGGALNLAPADDHIIQVERPLAIDAESQLLASVIAKKASVSATHVLFDIPFGEGSKIPTKNVALQLKRDFEIVSKKMGITPKVILTDGRQPIGNGIGPALEARDVLRVLRNDPLAPKDLAEKSLMMAGLLLEMGKKAAPGKGRRVAADIVKSGKAYEKLKEIVHAQGARGSLVPEQIPVGKHTYGVKAVKSGVVASISNAVISKIARVAGAPADRGSGIYLHRHCGRFVKKGDLLYTIHSENSEHLKYAVLIATKHDSGIVITD
ncbi:AMP phosphorylase [Candidatus Woesearchaeota archaeon]|nr:AMP phosphorylase [Candidatus Woesearchaeota archaeon]